MSQSDTVEMNSKDKIEKILSGYNAEAAEYTKILSSICRQLAFGEGTLFLLLIKKPLWLVLLGLIALLFYFIFDAIQYLWGYIKYKNISKKLERDYRTEKNDDEYHYELNKEFNLSLDIIFYIKLVFIVLASLFLIIGFLIIF
jgi:hypothetical protein